MFISNIYQRNGKKDIMVNPTAHMLTDYCWTIVHDNEDCT